MGYLNEVENANVLGNLNEVENANVLGNLNEVENANVLGNLNEVENANVLGNLNEVENGGGVMNQTLPSKQTLRKIRQKKQKHCESHRKFCYLLCKGHFHKNSHKMATFSYFLLNSHFGLTEMQHLVWCLFFIFLFY